MLKSIFWLAVQENERANDWELFYTPLFICRHYSSASSVTLSACICIYIYIYNTYIFTKALAYIRSFDNVGNIDFFVILQINIKRKYK